MVRIFFSLSLFISLIISANCQNTQWAHKVLGFSSQYGPKTYSANQVLGKPNVLPYKDSPAAWSPMQEQSAEPEWIKVGFRSPTYVQQIVIAESYQPGAIVRVFLYEVDGREHMVYKLDKPKVPVEQGRMFHIPLSNPTNYKVAACKVVLNTGAIFGWNHIDAIGICATKDRVETTINLAEYMEFDHKPQNLGTGVNSRYDEIMPIISPDGKTLYFDRKDHPNNTKRGTKNDDIWYSEVNSSGFWVPSKNIGPPLNNDGHNFLSAITPDGNTVLLGNVYESDGAMSSGLSISHRTRDGWSFPQKLTIKDYYNLHRYSEFYMGADGKTIIMAIERNDSYGGKDLYVSHKQHDGLWSVPENLGQNVNSAGNEMSPFLAADGKSLYFSSNGFPGYGSNDMYMSKRLDHSWKNWSEPQNLGPTINTPKWDAYYSIPASGEYAYYSSENHALGATDIFKIKLPNEIKPDPVVLLQGKVLDKDSNQPVEAEIVYEILSTGEEVGTAISSPTTGEYKIVLPGGEKYGVRATAKKYLSVNEHLDYTHIDQYVELTKDLYLVPVKKGETIVLNNIFFEPTKSDLNPDSKLELNRVVQFLKDNPTVVILIGGHTNNSCSEDWCLKLSTMRAKSVANYLIGQGMPKTRVSYKGYGSKKPIASNNTREGKIQNRRVDFTIVDM